MLIVLKPNVSQEEIDHIVDKIRSLSLEPHVSTGVQRTIITVIGDEDVIREQPLEALAGTHVGEPCPPAARRGSACASGTSIRSNRPLKRCTAFRSRKAVPSAS